MRQMIESIVSAMVDTKVSCGVCTTLIKAMTWFSSSFKLRMVVELMAHNGNVRNVYTRSRKVINSRSFCCIMQMFINAIFINYSATIMYHIEIVAKYN